MGPLHTLTHIQGSHTQAYTLWGILGIRERLYCRQHINKMFHFSLSAVCLKAAPVLHRSCSTLSLHRRLPHFSPTIFICVVLQRERKQSRFAPEEHQRWEKRIEESRKVFLVLLCFFLYSLCFVNSGSPENRAAGVSFRVDTGTLGNLSLLRGKGCEKLFY